MSTLTIEMLYDFIDSEKKAEQEVIFQLWELPLIQRIEKKAAIDNCSITYYSQYKGYKNIYFVECAKNYSNLKIGEPIIVSLNDPFNPCAEATIVDIDDIGNILFTCFRSPKIDFSLKYTLDKGRINLSQFQKKALQNANINEVINTLNTAYNTQRKNTTQTIASLIPHQKQNEFLQFNNSQQAAILNALQSTSYSIIQGPPGTGKSRVTAFIASILCQYKNEKVLISGPTHLSINNVLVKCENMGVYGKQIYKIGKRYNCDGISEESNINLCYRINPYDINLGKGLLIGASPIALHTSSAQGIEVDTLIIDEAGQLNILMATMAMVAAKRYIIIGDNQQMQPIIHTDIHPPILNNSIMGLLCQHSTSILLDTSYRMNKELVTFSSQHFYNKKLKVHHSNENKKLTISKTNNFWDILNPNNPSVFVDLNYSNTTSQCEIEAEYINKIIRELISNGTAISEIAVVCPFRSQCRLIKRKIKDINLRQAIIVDTIEKMQGQEKEVILFSWTVSDKIYLEKITEFFFNPYRLNVAITRAKTKLITLGSSTIFTQENLSIPTIKLYYEFYKSNKILKAY